MNISKNDIDDFSERLNASFTRVQQERLAGTLR